MLVLAALLFLPVSHLIWTLSLRKLGPTPDDLVLNQQKRRARIWAVPITLIFSYLFHQHVLA